MNEPPHGTAARRSVYALLIALAVGNMLGRVLSVNNVDTVRLEGYRIDQRLQEYRDQLAQESLSEEQIAERVEAKRDELTEKLRLQRPFLSANDRSRWMAARALVEHGTFAIDKILVQPTWDSIDIVRHRGADGEYHFYSSKPPLTYLHLAAAYWMLNRTTGLSLADEPHAAGRVLVIVTNGLPLVVMLVVMAWLIEQLGATDFGRIVAMGVISLGTFLTTFATVANNHLPAAAAAAVAVAAYVRMRRDIVPAPWLMVVAGLAAALTAANELPALAFLVLLGLLAFYHWPRATFAYFVPTVLIVFGAYVGVNKLAHDSYRPPYMHRSESNPDDNWYLYEYVDAAGQTRQSYWMNRQGIDAGEPNRATYAWHCLLGHHGVFSLTPAWLLTIAGIGIWLARGTTIQRELALATLALSVTCLVFYCGMRPLEDRNYGGMTSGFRWMFWFAPLWTLLLMPAADRLDCCRGGRAVVLTLVALSVMSGSYPTWNPWTQPWIWNWLAWWQTS